MTPPRAAPAVNPFAGLGWQDPCRDAVAAVLLLSALGLGWDVDGNGGNHWWVTVAVLVSLASLALPYVARAGAIPAFTPAEARLGTLAAAAPAVASVLAAVVNEFAHLDDPVGGGIGPAVGLLGAGAVLAAQPRAIDDRPGPHDRLWRDTGLAVAALAPVVALVTWLVWLLGPGAVGWDSPLTMVGSAFVAGAGLVLVLTTAPLVRLFDGDRVSRRVHLAVAGTVVAVALLSVVGDAPGVFFAPAEKFSDPLSGAGWLLPPAAALLVSSPAGRALRPAHPVGGWIETAGAALLLVAVGTALVTVGTVLVTIGEDLWGAAVITYLVLTVLIGAAATVGRAQLRRDAVAARPMVIGIGAGSALLGVIAVAVAHGSDELTSAFAWPQVAVLIALPLVAALVLVVPPAVRMAFGPLAGHHQQG